MSKKTNALPSLRRKFQLKGSPPDIHVFHLSLMISPLHSREAPSEK